MLSKFSIIFLFLSLLVVYPTEGFGQNKRVERADRAFELKQYNEAIELYQKAYKKVRRKDRKEAARLVFQTAMSYYLSNDIRRAEPWFFRATRLGYEDPIAILYHAHSLMKNEKYQEALERYKNYLEQVPDDWRGENGMESAKMALNREEKESPYIVDSPRILFSREDDYTPAYGDRQNNSLIFASSREEALGDDEDPWTGQKHTSLFISYQDRSGSWSKPALLDEGPINTEYNEGAPSVNISGTEMFFTRCTRSPDVDMGCRIFSSQLEGSSWGEPQEVVLTNDSTVSVGHPAISPDDLELYFVSDMKGGNGGYDIWVARRRGPGDEFGPAINLGNNINTPADEMFPYVREDGTLYFSSEGHPGYGGLDIFSTQQTLDGWSQPENPGTPFNSHADDFGIVYNGLKEEGFFTSSRSGRSGYDLYSFNLPPLEFVIKGTVRDDSTQTILTNSVVQLVGSDGTLFQAKTDSRGIYEFNENVVREDVSYQLLVSKEMYFSERGDVSTIGLAKSQEFVKDFTLKAIPETPIELPEILYEYASWELQPQFRDSLNTLIQTLEDNPTIIVELASHTDSRGTDAFNDTLSQKRAQAVVDYLIEKGINPDRLRARGYGKRVPRVIESDIESQGFEFRAGTILDDSFINSLESDEHRNAAHQLNRRTEFRVLSDDFKPSEDASAPKPVPVELYNQDKQPPPD